MHTRKEKKQPAAKTAADVSAMLKKHGIKKQSLNTIEDFTTMLEAWCGKDWRLKMQSGIIDTMMLFINHKEEVSKDAEEFLFMLKILRDCLSKQKEENL